MVYGSDYAMVRPVTFVQLPASLKASASASADNAIKARLTQQVSLNFQRIEMSQSFRDANLAACRTQAPRSSKIITGISVVTVSSQFARDLASEALANQEASAEYQGLDASTKNSYSASKTSALKGGLSGMSFVIRVAYEIV